MSENNDTSNESNSLGSDSNQLGLRSTAGGGNSLLRSSVLRPSVLAPSKLGTTTDSADAKPKESIGANPFMRSQNDDDDENGEALASGGAATASTAGSGVESQTHESKADTEEKSKSEDDEEPDERPDPLTMLRKNGLERANMFAAAKSSIPRVEKSGFVFGQNVHERVVVDNANPEGITTTTTDSTNTDSATAASSSSMTATTTTPGEFLFSSVIQNAAKSNENNATTSKETESRSLTEAAREYEESRGAQKRKYEEVETFTGEENEVNIVDINNCKLFAFVNSNWEERGRGSLRLNDSKIEQECSRVVFRTSGTLRLVLNTKVWAGMVAERPSQKSLRLTAMDNTGKIKIFLVMSRPADISQLYTALHRRIESRKVSHPEECHAVAAHNNGNEVSELGKNGVTSTSADDAIAIVDTDDSQGAAVATIDLSNDSSEPSPKKPLFAEEN